MKKLNIGIEKGLQSDFWRPILCLGLGFGCIVLIIGIQIPIQSLIAYFSPIEATPVVFMGKFHPRDMNPAPDFFGWTCKNPRKSCD